MIHIKDDLRSKKSAELVRTGLERCLQHKDFTEITVTEIIKESGVGRATFYRLFDNSYDVLAYQCELLSNQLIEQFKLLPAEEKNFLRFSISFWLKHYVSLEAIFASNRTDILQESMLKDLEFLMHHFELQKISEVELDYLLTTATSVLSSMLMVWIKRGMNETAEEIYQMYMKKLLI